MMYTCLASTGPRLSSVTKRFLSLALMTKQPQFAECYFRQFMARSIQPVSSAAKRRVWSYRQRLNVANNLYIVQAFGIPLIWQALLWKTLNFNEVTLKRYWHLCLYLINNMDGHRMLFFRFLPEASFGLLVLSLPACVCVLVSVNHELVRAIIHQPFKLGSPNLDQICKRPWLRALLFCGTIDRDLLGQIELQIQNLPHFEHVHAMSHNQLKLQFPNLEQNCILALFRSVPILGWIEIDFQFNF